MENLKEYILSLGVNLVGFADLTTFPAHHRSNMPYGISIGIAVKPDIVSLIPQKATIEYFNEYQGINKKLDEIGIRIQENISNRGYAAIAQTVDFVRKQREENDPNNSASHALMPHKTVAALSGLGWIAKSSLLVTEQYGSAIRITSILTDAPISIQKSKYKCLCGNCKICSENCPGNVIKNKEWSFNTSRDELIDFYSCRRTVEKRGQELGIRHGACGICMAVCPYTQRYINKKSGLDPAERPEDGLYFV